MARQRFIHPEIWDDPDLGRVSPLAFILYVGCFSNADDDGRLLGDPAYLKTQIFRYRKLDLEDVLQARGELVAVCRSFVVYEHQGVEYVCFLNWAEYQKPKYPKPSKLPPPPGWKRPKPAPASQKSSGNDSPNRSPNASGSDFRNDSSVGWGGEGRDGLEAEERLQETPRDPTLTNGLPFTHELRTTEILAAIGAHADEGTAGVIRSIARRLPEASLAKVAESTKRSRIKDRAAYAVKALQSELTETGRETDSERRTRKIAALRQDPEAWVRTNGHRLPDQALAEWLNDLVDAGDEVYLLRPRHLDALGSVLSARGTVDRWTVAQREARRLLLAELETHTERLAA